MLGSAFQQALAFGMIGSNPVRAVKSPKIERATLSVPTVDSSAP
jgi:hypothetical protein